MDENRQAGMLQLWVRASNPLLLFGELLTYAIGAGIADYLGINIDWEIFVLGLAWIISLHLGGVYLYEYYTALYERIQGRVYPNADANNQTGSGKRPVTLLVASAACLTAVASLSVLMLRQVPPSPEAWMIMALTFLGVLAISIPPLRLASTGYGELVVSILIANLVPALGYLLQAGELHRLLAMSTFPLTPLCLSTIIIFQLSGYTGNVRQQRQSLLAILGWRRAMALHNGMILAAFLLLALALTFGLPFFIGLPAFLPLPLGLLQIWQLRRIADGIRPNWLSLKLTAVALFATPAYLLAYAFWVR